VRVREVSGALGRWLKPGQAETPTPTVSRWLTVCLVVGSVGWSGSNPCFGDGSNPCFVWLREWVRSVFCLVGGLRWGRIHPIFCLVGWIQTEPAYGHLCTEMVRLPSSIYATHSNICAQHIAIFHMLAPCIKDQHTK